MTIKTLAHLMLLAGSILQLNAMSDNRNLAWQQRSKMTSVVSQKGKIVIPAFSIPTGPPEKCFYFSVGGPRISGVNPDIDLQSMGEWTLEGWFKVPASILQFATASQVSLVVQLGAEAKLQILHYRGKLYWRFVCQKADASETVLPSADAIALNKWTHFRLKWTGTTLIMYMDGEETSRTALPNILAGEQQFKIFTSESEFPFYACELRLFDAALGDHTLHRRFNIVSADTANLNVYFKLDNLELNAGDGLYYTTETVSGGSALCSSADPDENLITDDGFPFSMRGSYPSAIVDVTTTKNCAFAAPINKPSSDVNFTIVARRVNNDGTVDRFYFWEHDSIIIPRASKYRGQHLGTSFKLEIWHVDGNRTADLEDDFTIYTQSRRVVTTADYSEIEEDAEDLTVDQDKYSAFPITFPNSFDQAQTTF